MAASIAIHGLFVFYVWNEFSLSSSVPQMTEVSVELVAPPSAESNNTPVKSSPVRIAKTNTAPESMPQEARPADSNVGTTEEQTFIAEQIAEESKDEKIAMAEPSSQMAAEPSKPVEVSRGSGNKVRKHELVRSRLEAHKFYPASARRRGIEGEVELGFALNSKGLADGLMVLASSGYSILDRAAMQTVHRAQPFPIFDGEYRVRLRFRCL